MIISSIFYASTFRWSGCSQEEEGRTAFHTREYQWMNENRGRNKTVSHQLQEGEIQGSHSLQSGLVGDPTFIQMDCDKIR